MSNPLPVSPDASSAPQCLHVDSRGHRCRMLALDGHDGLCAHHYSRSAAKRRKEDEFLVQELLGPIDDFSTPASVNLFLGNLLKQLVYKRIERADAVAQAYICQLLLNTFRPMHQERCEAEEDNEHRLFLETIAKPRKPSPPLPDRADSFVSTVVGP